MGFKKENKDLLKEAFSKALEQEIAETPNVGEDHEFSPHFSYQMEKVIEKSKTVKFKLTSPKAQRYIAAGIAAAFIVSTFTVAAKIVPPKTGKLDPTISTESIDKDNLSSKDKQNSKKPTSSTSGDTSNPKKHHSSKPPKNNVSSQIGSVSPLSEEAEETASIIYAEGYIASYESMFLAESDSSYVFNSTDKLHNRWKDLTLCRLNDNAENLSINLPDLKLNYMAIPLSNYPYSDAIINLKGESLVVESNGLENATLYLPNYRSDTQYLIIETETESYLAKYLNCDGEVTFEEILEQVYDVKSANSFIHTAILNIKGNYGNNHTLTKREIESLYSNLFSSTLANSETNSGEIIKKLIITTEQGGTINLFYSSDGVITLVNDKQGNHITLSPEQKNIFDDLLGLSSKNETSSELNSSAASAEVESTTSVDSDESSKVSSKNTSSQNTTSIYSELNSETSATTDINNSLTSKAPQ